MKQRYYRHSIRTAVIVTGTLLVLFGYAWVRSGSGPRATALRTWTRLTYATIRPLSGDILLPVAFDAQDHSLSCEVATLKMALRYRGVEVSEADLIIRIGVDRTPRQQDGNITIWGDPNRAFVGNIDGRMFVNGYGVYEEPVARAGATYRETDSFRGWSIGQLAAQVFSGNPVIVWGYLGNGERVTWVTLDGTPVEAVSYEHTYLVYGFRGDVQRPDGFYVIDPIYGPKYLDAMTFTTMWSALGKRGVIVY